MQEGKSNRSLWIGLVVVIVVVALIASSRSGKDEVIKIGYFGPFTGPVAATTGEDIANGFKLAHAERYEIDGKQVEVIYEDDACDPQKAVTAANKLVSIDKVSIVVSGVCSGSSFSASSITEKNKVILFTPVSTTPKLTTAGDYVFRTSASAVVTGEAIVQSVQEMGYKRAAIIYEAAEYPVGIKDVFVAKFPQIPGNVIVATESSAPKDTDFRSQLLKVSQTKPDIILIVMNSTITANAVLKQRAELKIKAPVIGNEYFIQKEVLANPDSDGIMASTYKYDPTTPAFTAFISKYKSNFSKEPSQDIYPALAYDGYNVLFSAMEKCGGAKPDCVRDELYKVKDYGGISGVITIDENGDTKREFVIKKISAGRIVDVK